MLKRFLCALLLLSVLFSVPALAAEATREYALDAIFAKIALSENYTVLTLNNLDQNNDLLTALGKTAESVREDFLSRGVLLQAWVKDRDACLEIRAVQDEDASTYFDIDQQTTQARASFRTSHLKGTKYSNSGYSVKAAEWKKQTKGGRFLRLKYKRTVNGYTYWGYAAKTVRNGWTVTLDYQVYNRGLKARDESNLNKAANEIAFTRILPMPANTAGLLEFTAVPPKETNTGSFTVEGTCTPGAHLIGALMRYSSPTPRRVEADATKAGKFKLKVELPDEGLWLMTLTVELNGNVITEEVFDTTTYKKSLLPLNLETEIPDQFATDEFTLTGTTSRNVSVQCVVTGGEKPFDKTVHTNGTGKFTFKIPTSSESEYSITLVLQKKNFDIRRESWRANRILTQEDIRKQYRDQAVKPAYSVLNRKIEAYTGKIMSYKVYIAKIDHVGEEWLVYAAMEKTASGKLKNLIVVSQPSEPDFVVNSEQKLLGTCTGLHHVQSEEGTEVSYPAFDLLFWE